MKILNTLFALGLLCLVGCPAGGTGAEGDECSTDADCTDGLHCHQHEDEDEDHGECEAEEEEA